MIDFKALAMKQLRLFQETKNPVHEKLARALLDRQTLQLPPTEPPPEPVLEPV